MALTHTTDANLLLETAQHDCIILKYHTDECGVPCNKLVPVYENLSETEAYKNIRFLRINADNNPVAKAFILNKQAPIVTIYYRGRLIESRSVTTEAEMRALLNKLVNEKSRL